MDFRNMKYRGQNWEDHKDEIKEWIDAGRKLADIRDYFEKKYGFQASPSAWNKQLSKWQFTKSRAGGRSKTAKRGLNLLYSHSTDPLVADHKSKYRKLLPRSMNPGGHHQHDEYQSAPMLNGATTPYIPCHMFGLEYRGGIAEELDEGYGSDFPLFPAFSVSSDFAGLARPPQFQEDKPSLSISEMLDDSPISVLELYFQNDVQPFSQYNFSHQVQDHDAFMGKLREPLPPIADDGDILNDAGDSLLFCSSNKGCRSDVYDFKSVEIPVGSRPKPCVDLFNEDIQLQEDQLEGENIDERTLVQEFERAKAAEKANLFEEAEFRCRSILKHQSVPGVEILLGLILLHFGALEESSSLFFRALAGFIVLSKDVSYRWNKEMIESIEAFYLKVFLTNKLRDHIGLQSMTNHLCQIISRLQFSYDEGNSVQMFPELLVHGLSIARDCEQLNMPDSAKHMYEHLLQFAPLYLHSASHGLQAAHAHREYGLLLRLEEEWNLSAVQLGLACECYMHAEVHDLPFSGDLQSDYGELLPHISVEGPLANRVRALLLQIMDHSSTYSSVDMLNNTNVSPFTPYLPNSIDLLLSSNISEMEISVVRSRRSKVSALPSATESTTGSSEWPTTLSQTDQLYGISNSELGTLRGRGYL